MITNFLLYRSLYVLSYVTYYILKLPENEIKHKLYYYKKGKNRSLDKYFENLFPTFTDRTQKMVNIIGNTGI